MPLVVWSLAGVCILLLAIFAFRCAAQLRLLRLRLALVERREGEVLETVARLTEASRTSSHAVLMELERGLRAAAPSVDTVLVFEASGEELGAIRVAGERAAHFEHVRYRIDGPPTALTRAALDGHRARLSPGVSALIPTDRAALAVPLCKQPQLSLVYLSAARTEKLENEDTLVRLIEQAGPPFALAREREADHASATYDGLTGLLSARAFRATLADEIAVARISSNASVSLWFIDTDHFKSVNDTYGHSAGDIVLQRMAQILGAHGTPGMDVVARNGGDEFCAIVKNVPKSVAILRAQRLCEAVAAFEFGVDIRISASIGVATYPTDVSSAHELLEVADAAMYHSKRNGRNRVSFSVEGMRFECFTHEGLPT
ncbi:MAG: GGDEF domain-containing protein [Candidatus Eremiobacteraeota bacterium]|nr:GGDEF domain-containing protein [Candidatus Eremiobacteraeota bacterium]